MTKREIKEVERLLLKVRKMDTDLGEHKSYGYHIILRYLYTSGEQQLDMRLDC